MGTSSTAEVHLLWCSMLEKSEARDCSKKPHTVCLERRGFLRRRSCLLNGYVSILIAVFLPGRPVCEKKNMGAQKPARVRARAGIFVLRLTFTRMSLLAAKCKDYLHW